MTQKIKRFHVLLRSAGIEQSKADILSGYGVESTKDLSEKQLDELIIRLVKMEQTKTVVSPELRKARSVVLNLLTTMGIYDNSGSWTRVNAYLLDKRICGKILYECSLEDLQNLAVKLRVINKKTTKDAKTSNFTSGDFSDN
jgi:hypothetical protein